MTRVLLLIDAGYEGFFLEYVHGYFKTSSTYTYIHVK